ncbi:unnamed protein product, partial [Polarella glacialis]
NTSMSTFGAATKSCARGSTFLRNTLRRLISTQEFDLFILVVIATNILVVGFEVDLSAGLPANEIPPAYAVLNLFFTSIFTIEIMLKMIAFGLVWFFTGVDRIWNWFDFLVVGSSLVEIALMTLAEAGSDGESLSMSHIRVFRLLRIARVFRGIRVMRILRFVRSLRTLLYSILMTLKSLVWTLILLSVIFYGFGVAFTQATADYCREQAVDASGDMNALPTCTNPDLTMYWSSLPRSMYTLFKAVSGGLSWHQASQPLAETGWLPVLFFIAFIAFTYFAVLNVVTGVFCQNAIESAQTDKELAVMVQLANKTHYVKAMRTLFTELDEDSSKTITIDEFEAKLKDERFAAYLESIDIDSGDAWTLFKLIDCDQSGCIDVEEFVSGCLQLRGAAKAIHIAKMGYENKIMRRGME